MFRLTIRRLSTGRPSILITRTPIRDTTRGWDSPWGPASSSGPHGRITGVTAIGAVATSTSTTITISIATTSAIATTSITATTLVTRTGSIIRSIAAPPLIRTGRRRTSTAATIAEARITIGREAIERRETARAEIGLQPSRAEIGLRPTGRLPPTGLRLPTGRLPPTGLRDYQIGLRRPTARAAGTLLTGRCRLPVPGATVLLAVEAGAGVRPCPATVAAPAAWEVRAGEGVEAAVAGGRTIESRKPNEIKITYFVEDHIDRRRPVDVRESGFKGRNGEKGRRLPADNAKRDSIPRS